MTFRILALPLALGVAAGATAVQAGTSDSDDIAVTASQAKVCIINTVGGEDTAIALGAADGTDGDALLDTALTGTEVYADTYCNAAHTVSLASANGGLTLQAGGSSADATSDAFTSEIEYQAVISLWATAGNITLDTETDGTTAVTGTVSDAFRNDGSSGTNAGSTGDGLTVTVTTDTYTDPVLQGDYADTITLTLTAS